MSPPAEDEDIEYDAESGTYRSYYDPESENPSLQVLEAVAAVRNVDPTDLDPLDRYIDPDALNAIFVPTYQMAGTHASISFGYEDLLVIVHSDGEVELREQA
jgi:predicted RNA-binding protein with PUA-like domain